MEIKKKFTEKLKTDQDYRTKLSALMDSGDTEALNTFMKGNGFTVDDIAALDAQNLWVHSTRIDEELNDDELEAISAAGFNWCNGMKLLVDSV